MEEEAGLNSTARIQGKRPNAPDGGGLVLAALTPTFLRARRCDTLPEFALLRGRVYRVNKAGRAQTDFRGQHGVQPGIRSRATPRARRST